MKGDEKLRVSVIVPTYNRAGYLRQALQSVLDQSFAPFEVIVVDDGSTDDTSALVHDFEPRVRCVRHDHNKGVSAARNTGLEVAQGEIIAWLDADDLWEPDYLATATALLQADEEIGGVYAGLKRIDSAGRVLPQVSRVAIPPAELYSALIEDCFILTSAFMARRTCFDQVGHFDTQFDICEDYDMFLRLAKRFAFASMPVPLVRYRIHTQNTVANLDAFCCFRLALTRKHFGKPEGDPQLWPADARRAHACAFRAVALKCIQGGWPEQAWRYVGQAVAIWPGLLGRLDTFYELACGDQPSGFRGHAESLDIEGNGRTILSWLDTLFAGAGPELKPMQAPAYGNAYLALGMLSDQAGRWGSARQYLLQAVQANPRLLVSYPVVRRMLKLCAGKRLVRALSRGRQAGQAQVRLL